MAKPRYCFAAGRKLTGTECCAAQKLFRSEVSRLQVAQPSLSGVYDQMIFLPLKVFFVVIVVLIAALLAFRRVELDKYYPELVPPIERGVIIGAFAMLLWPIMDYGYQQTSDVMFGNYYGGFNPRWSLVIAPWAILLLFFFLRRFGKNLAMVGQMGGIAGGLFAVLRYQDVNNWAQRFLGGGAEQWMAFVYAGLAVIGLALLLWPRKTPQGGVPA